MAIEPPFISEDEILARVHPEDREMWAEQFAAERASEPPFNSDLLGQRVVVKLADHVVARGRLLMYNDWGEVVLEDESGGFNHCWPALTIEAADA